MINHVTDTDYDQAIFQATLGQPIDKFILNGNASSVIEYFAEQEGYIEKINLNFLKNISTISNIKIRYTKNDFVKKARDGGKNIVSVFITNNNPAQIQKDSIDLFEKIKENIKII